MKKYICLLVASLIILLSIEAIDYKRYSKITNNVVSSLIDNIKDKYPNVEEEELIKIINDEGSNNVMKSYGFIESDTSYIKSLNNEFKKNLIINSFIVIFFLSIVYLIIFIKRKKEVKEIDNITNYLKKINEGIYDLEIIDNKETELSILKNEVYKTVITLRTSLEKISNDKLIIKDNLANIAHQLKNPLTSILLMIDMILDGNLSKEKTDEFLKDIERGIENINFLIIEMLKLSRFDAEVVEFKKEEVNIKDIINNAIKNVDILREVKDINIIINGVDAIINVDKSWQEEAITNIIKNAIEHSNNKRNIIINYTDKGSCVLVEVIDNGSGINSKDIKRIFDRFYKSNKSDNNFGIGLSLAKEIIKKDNGQISVSSKNNETKFVIKYYR